MKVPVSEIRYFLLNEVDLNGYDYYDVIKAVFLQYSDSIIHIEISEYISLNEYNERI